MNAIVFDVGGTSMRSARVAAGPRIEERFERPSPSHRVHTDDRGDALVERFVAAVVEDVARLDPTCTALDIAIGFPGPVDDDGRAWHAPTIWGDRVVMPVDVRARLAAAFQGRRVLVVNDVTAAGHRFASERGQTCAVVVGSGIGHKLFLDGRAVVGPHGLGGEFGHWRVDFAPGAPLCDCGGRGHLGALASGRALEFQLASADRRLSGSSMLSDVLAPWFAGGGGDLLPAARAAFVCAAAARDPFALDVVARLADPLGRALAALHLAVGVEDFVVFGGFARALGSVYLESLHTSCANAAWDIGPSWSEMVRLGPDDDDSGILGLARAVELQRERGA